MENQKPQATPTLSFGKAISNCFHKYATFKGRARRSEYWWFCLLAGIVGAVVQVAANSVMENGVSFGGAVAYLLLFIFYIALIIPSLAVLFRRLHDTGRSGWWWFINLIPLIGWIVMIVFCCDDSDPNPNKYGESPKYLLSKEEDETLTPVEE